MIKTCVYDSFRCIADKCPMTCCKGWSIRVEQENYNNWKSKEETAYLCEQVSFERKDGENVYHMKVDSCKTCLMLDEQGLCEIVKRHGDEALSKTCAEFPRKHNFITESDEDVEDIAILSEQQTESQIFMDEYSVSGACPAVLQLIYELENGQHIVEIPEKINDNMEFPMEYRIRNMLITLLGKEEFSLFDRIMLCSAFLHECLECEWEDDVYDCIEVYAEDENLQETIQYYAREKYNEEDAFMELCQTFFDVTQYYKEEPMYRPYLEKIAAIVEQFDEETDLTDWITRWKAFQKDFAEYEAFLTKVMIAEVFSDCISEDVEYLIESFQSIVMEYLMTRLSLFLTEEKIEREQLIAYLALYIRMIGHNVEGMSEYWEDNFEDPILTLEYMFLLLQ